MAVNQVVLTFPDGLADETVMHARTFDVDVPSDGPTVDVDTAGVDATFAGLEVRFDAPDYDVTVEVDDVDV